MLVLPPIVTYIFYLHLYYNYILHIVFLSAILMRQSTIIAHILYSAFISLLFFNLILDTIYSLLDTYLIFSLTYLLKYLTLWA
jgi:hypothetical protein